MPSATPNDSAIFQNRQTRTVFSKSERKLVFISLAIVLLSSTIFGLWFKIQQISIASPEIIYFYPVTGYAIAVLQSIFFFSALWLGLVLAYRFIGRDDNGLANNLFAGSLPFTAFMLSAFDVTLPVQTRLFLLLSAILFFIKFYKNRSLLEELKEPLTALILIFLVFLFLFKGWSPFFYTGFYNAWGGLDFFVQLEHQFENAKAYDFLQDFTQQAKLGGHPRGMLGGSELLSLLMLLLDIPFVDYLAKYGLIHQTWFWLFVFGSWGCYLFFRYGLLLSLLPSLIGGLGFIFGNSSFLGIFSGGGEYALYQMPYFFLPWISLLLKRSYDLNKPILACVAGLAASFPDYVFSSHLEATYGYLIFCNAYNVYLALVRLAKNRFTVKSIGGFFIDILIFPFFYVWGLSYKLIPLMMGILTKENTLPIRELTVGFGLLWEGWWKYYSTFLFRFGDALKGSGSNPFMSPITGRLMLFYTGQFTILMVFTLFFYFFADAWEKFFKKGAKAEPNIFWENVSYFALMFLFFASTMPMGSSSWLSKLMVWSEVWFLRFHMFERIGIFYYFIPLASAACGLECLIRRKNLLQFNIIFGAYLFTLLAVYFSPMLIAQPEKVFLDGGILLATYVSIALFIKSHSLFENGQSVASYRSFLALPIIAIAFISFLTVNTDSAKTATQQNNPSYVKDRLFTSFREQVAHLRNNRHDRASFEFLERRLEKLYDDLDIKERQGRNVTAYYNKINQIRKTYSSANKLEYFEAIAPEVDDFYYNDGHMFLLLGGSPSTVGFFANEPLNGTQYYLPGKYQLLANLGADQISGFIWPTGKNSELIGVPYCTTQNYSFIGVNFYMLNLFDPLNKLVDTGLDYTNTMLSFERITGNKSAKKILNIIGVDYLIFSRGYLNHFSSGGELDYIEASGLRDRTSPKDTLDDLKAMGFTQVDRPEFSQYAHRFGTSHDGMYSGNQVIVFENPRSYGKAYVAKWVKNISPAENMLNLDLSRLPKGWATSTELLKNFQWNLTKIPEDIEQAAIIESPTAGDHSDSPRVYESNNDVSIVKIIGSKAVFNVNCDDEHCWFVYNTAALKGWQAFSGSTPLPIHQANLAFIGVKLNKGKHFVWMEYRPLSLPLSFMVVLSGWIVVLFWILKSDSKDVQQNNQFESFSQHVRKRDPSPGGEGADKLGSDGQ